MAARVPMSKRKKWSLIASLFIIGAIAWTALLTGNASAATPSAAVWAPITVGAFEAQCVVPNGTTTVDFDVYNTGTKTMIVVGIPWGVSTIGESAQSHKGPTTLVNTTSSGLIKTTRLPVWHWVVKVAPRKWTKVSLIVLNTGAYYDQPNWDPSWGIKPISRFYTGATFYVRYTSQTIDVPSHPAHCKQLGGK